MEGRYDQALALIEELRTIAEKTGDMGVYVAASVKLARVYENLGEPDQALDVLKTLICHPKAEEERSWYWWAQYHIGINLHKLSRSDCARNVLEKVRERGQGDLALSALHQLGVIDLEEGRLEQAKEKFEQCLRERSDDEYNHRRAFEYRRLGQTYALMDRFKEAQQAFAKAMRISQRCGDWRYVRRTRQDVATFLIAPSLRTERPATIMLPELAHRFDVEKGDLMGVFHLLQAERLGYIEVIDAESAQPTDQVVRWDVAHREDWWHTSVTVLIVDDKGNLALQQRGESHSRGRWDVSAAGHVDVGEDDISAAARETQEELGIALSPERLVRLGGPYEFQKIGTPSVKYDVYESPTFLRYRTDKVNCERVSAFAARVSEEEKQQIVTGRNDGALAVRWLQPADAVEESVVNRERFASAFKQLFGHDETRDRILREIRLLIGKDE
jgi:8-oxo-dGTP pyrophosphatase MutT (NUDIX family)/predicted negative regulator of RcsB-dependent stress response